MKKTTKKNSGLKNIQSLMVGNLNLSKFKVNPNNIIKGTKNKIEHLYGNYKKEKEKEKKRLEKKKKLDEK